MRLTYLTHLFIYTFMLPLANFFDRVLTNLTFALDFLLPISAMAADLGLAPPLTASREVAYLTGGVHRMAQNVLRRGPNDDDDGPEDMDNGLTAVHPRR